MIWPSNCRTMRMQPWLKLNKMRSSQTVRAKENKVKEKRGVRDRIAKIIKMRTMSRDLMRRIRNFWIDPSV